MKKNLNVIKEEDRTIEVGESDDDITKSYEQTRRELLVEQRKNHKIFGENKSGIGKSGCCGKCFFTWINPLIDFTREKKKLHLNNYGVLRECDMVEGQIVKLKKTWLKYSSDKKKISKHALFKSVIFSFKFQYMITMIMTLTSSILQLSSPLLIKPLIEYVKTGENKWEGKVTFFDFQDN